MELDSGLGPVSGVTPQMYMSKMDGDLTPQQLSKYTEHSLRRLAPLFPSFPLSFSLSSLRPSFFFLPFLFYMIFPFSFSSFLSFPFLSFSFSFLSFLSFSFLFPFLFLSFSLSSLSSTIFSPPSELGAAPKSRPASGLFVPLAPCFDAAPIASPRRHAQRRARAPAVHDERAARLLPHARARAAARARTPPRRTAGSSS